MNKEEKLISILKKNFNFSYLKFDEEDGKNNMILIEEKNCSTTPIKLFCTNEDLELFKEVFENGK